MTKAKQYYERCGVFVPKDQVKDLESVCRQYLKFCESPFYRPGQWVQDFWEMCAHPNLSAITITDDGQLLLGIKDVVITNPNTNYKHIIGDFVITLRRHPSDQKTISFEACEPIFVKDYDTIFYHPHINDKGQLCIDEGKLEMYNALARGDILEVFEYVMKILITMDEYPFIDVSLWPLVKE